MRTVVNDSSGSDLQSLAVGAGLSIIGKFVGRFLAVLGDIIAARILGPTIFGLYSIGWTLIRIIGLLAPLGLPVGVLRFIPALLGKNNQKIQSFLIQSVVISFSTGVGIGTLLFFISPWLAQNIYHKPELTQIFRLFSLIIPFMSLLSITGASSRAYQDMRYTVLIEDLGQPFCGLILVVVIYLLVGRWLAGVIISDLLSYTLMGFTGLFVVRKLFSISWMSFNLSVIKESILREVLIFSVPASLAGAFTIFVFWVDRLMVGYYLPAYENGLYQAASQLSVVFVVMIAAFNAIVAPMFADLHTNGEILRLEEIYRVSTKWQLYFGIPIFLVFVFDTNGIIKLLYGIEYIGATKALLILLVGQFVNIGTGSVATLLIMTGFQKVWLFFSGLSLGINLLFCILLIPQFGIVGAAISTSISLSVVYIGAIIVTKYVLGIWPYDKRFFKGGIASLICIVVTILLRKFLANGSWQILIFSALLIVITFLGSLFLLGVDSEDKNLGAQLISWIGIKTER